MNWTQLIETSKFNQGIWTFTASPPLSLQIHVIGEASHFELFAAQHQLVVLISEMQNIVLTAGTFAKNSVYQSVIDDCDGISCDNLIVEAWDKIRVWFRLNNAAHRMLGVLILSGVPTDVYCDSP